MCSYSLHPSTCKRPGVSNTGSISYTAPSGDLQINHTTHVRFTSHQSLQPKCLDSDVHRVELSLPGTRTNDQFRLWCILMALWFSIP